VEQLDPSSIIEAFAASVTDSQHSNVQMPAWSKLLLVVGVISLAIAVVPTFLNSSERVQRLFYWFGLFLGASLIAVAVSPRGWLASVAVFGGGITISLIWAFFSDTSLLKIGNRQISYTMMDRRQKATTADGDEPLRSTVSSAESYVRVISARYRWWLVAACTCGLAAGLYLVGWTWIFSISVVVAVALAALSGFEDGTRHLTIGRGQKVPFAIASIASLMMFALPLLAYVAGYVVGKRWPVAHGKHAVDRNDEYHEPG
jgi:hypothetical protein